MKKSKMNIKIWTDKEDDTHNFRGYVPLPKSLIGSQCHKCGSKNLTGVIMSKTADEMDPDILCLNCGFWRN